MKTTLIPLSLIFIGLAGTILGCSSTQSGRPVGSASPLGNWTLWLIQGETVETAVPMTAKTPTLHIDSEGQISGTAGVNQYSATSPADVLAQNRFELGPHHHDAHGRSAAGDATGEPVPQPVAAGPALSE